MDPKMRWIVFFDESCSLCSRSIRFLAHADHRDHLRFAPLQGETAKQRGLSRYSSLTEGTMVVWRESDGATFLRSDSLLELFRALGGFWRSLLLLNILPYAYRESTYRLIARNRIRWFGHADDCTVVDPQLASRLLP